MFVRAKLTFESTNGKEIVIPVQHNHVIQSLIYNTFSPIFAKKLHDEGFAYKGRRFKLFTFSRILEKGIKDNKNLIFKNSVSFYFSTPLEEILIDIATEAVAKQKFNILNQEVYLSKIEIVKNPQFSSPVLIKMLSPLTIYSTLKTDDGRKKIYYYKPNDKDFSKLIEQNAIKKYNLIHGESSEQLSLSITPFRFSVKENLVVAIFRNTPIEAYTGIFKLEGSEKLIKTVYDTGIGGKNSEGFGMWEIWKGGA